MKLKGLLIVVFFSLLIKVYASNDSLTQDSLPSNRYDFLILSSKYQNAFTFVGRDFGQNLPLWTTDAMYYFDNGLYVNGSVIKFLDADIPIQYSGTLGYVKDLTNRLDVNLSYSRFFMSSDSEISGIQNLSFVQGGIGLDWGLLYSTFSGQWLFGNQTDFFISSQHSRYFQFNEKLFDKIKVGFEPKFTFMAGSRLFHLGSITDVTAYPIKEFESIKSLAWEASMPIHFSISSWEVEFSTRYVNPLNVPDFDFSTKRWMYSVELSYALPIKRKSRGQ
jgi:hypothetical protein